MSLVQVPKIKSHTTANEIAYIQTIGTHYSDATTMRLPKKQLLENYIKSLGVRSNFAGMDKPKIVHAAYMELQNCN